MTHFSTFVGWTHFVVVKFPVFFRWTSPNAVKSYPSLRWWRRHQIVSGDVCGNVYIWWCVMVNNQSLAGKFVESTEYGQRDVSKIWRQAQIFLGRWQHASKFVDRQPDVVKLWPDWVIPVDAASETVHPWKPSAHVLQPFVHSQNRARSIHTGEWSWPDE